MEANKKEQKHCKTNMDEESYEDAFTYLKFTVGNVILVVLKCCCI